MKKAFVTGVGIVIAILALITPVENVLIGSWVICLKVMITSTLIQKLDTT